MQEPRILAQFEGSRPSNNATLVACFIVCPIENSKKCKLAIKDSDVVWCQYCFQESCETDPIRPGGNFTTQEF